MSAVFYDPSCLTDEERKDGEFFALSRSCLTSFKVNCDGRVMVLAGEDEGGIGGDLIVLNEREQAPTTLRKIIALCNEWLAEHETNWRRERDA
jgi:hypothetical protein